MSDSAIPWTPARQASLSTTNSRNLLILKSIELVMPSNQIILCCPLLLLPSIFSSIGVFSNESVLHNRWPKFGASASVLPKNIQGIFFFRINWFDLLAVQGTLSSPQFKSINSLACSSLYGPMLTSIHDYWKNHSFDKEDLFWQNNVFAF